MDEQETLPLLTADPFRSLGLDDALVAGVTALGYEEPTAIQSAAIPPLLAGRDLLGQAATGTGKTAAFALPLLQRIGPYGDGPRAVRGLVITPTRELAMQVAEAIYKYGRPLGVRVLPIYGGSPFGTQLRALQRGVDVVVATPGRALDHIRRETLSLDAVTFVVLDEADEMLDMGFAEELDAVLAAVPAARQTALFSATMARRILGIAQKQLTNPIRITIAPAAETGQARVREIAFIVQRQHKATALGRVLDMESPKATIVFCRTRTEVDELTETLSARGYRAEALHGGLTQEQRDRVLRRFRDENSDVLVATDVAARGLDIDHVSHVVNFDLPASADAYVHRVGRTARAGREGVAITFVEAREQRLLQNIERLTKHKIRVEGVPTVHDLRERRLALTGSALREALQADGLDRYRPLVEELAEEFPLADIAAAAAKLAMQAQENERDDVEIPAPAPLPPPAVRAPRPTDGNVARLYVGLGRLAGIRPADLAGAIINEGHLASGDIGAIQIADRFSLVEVPADKAEVLVHALRTATLRGKPMRPRLDRM